MAAMMLASFSSQARGIKFYGVHTGLIQPGVSLTFCLEPLNAYDNDCIAVWVTSCSSPTKLGHLAREDARCLAPLLKLGLTASG